MTTLLPIALGLLLQSTALLLVGLIAMRLARRHGPAVQSLLGRATLAGVALALLLAGPLAGHVKSVWNIRVSEATPAPNSGATAPDGGARADVGAPLAAPSARDATPYVPASSPTPPELGAGGRSFSPPALSPAVPPAFNPVTPAPRRFLLCPTLAATWAAGTALLLLWLALCQQHLTRLRRQAAPITSGPAAEALAALTTRPPLLLAHPSVRSPFLAGLRRPAIFLPTAYETEFDPASLRAILAHELAHLARRDNAWTLAARLLTALLWLQPLLWVLCRRLEQTGEEACDSAVLAQDCPPRAYADCLLTLAERHPRGRRERALGVGVAPFRSSLGRRISRIIEGKPVMSVVPFSLRLAVTLGLLLTVSMTLLTSSTRVSGNGVTPALRNRTKSQALQSEAQQAGGASTHEQVVKAQASLRFLEQQNVDVRKQLERAREALLIYRLGPRGSQNTQQRADLTRDYAGLKAHYDDLQTQMHQQILVLSRLISTEYITHATPASSGNTNMSGTGTNQTQALAEVRFLAGLTPVQGPGVVVTLRDSKKSLPAMPNGIAPPSIIHDSDINQVVNELKAAGAEAVAVNGQRLVATSSVRTAGPTVLINFVPTAPPYVIKAIGDPKTLAAAMNLSGGVASQIKAFDPAMFSVREANALKLPAYTGGSQPRYARPAGLTDDSIPLADLGKQSAMKGVGQPTIMLADYAPKTIPDFKKPTDSHASARMTDFDSYLNMKRVALAVWQYAYHHTDRFPDADRWMDEIKPYLKTEDYYHDPAAPASERYSYAYNRNLSGAADDRVSDMSETVMLFESSLNVRNASDTGQSLIKPARHGGQPAFVCVNIGGAARNGHPSFALHVTPPNFFAKASPDQLIRLQKRTQTRLVSERSTLTAADQQFEGELRRALPQADAPKLTQARMLEMKIGLQVMGLQNAGKFPQSKAAAHHRAVWTEAQLRPLLVQEAQMLPNLPSPQRTRLHSVAASLTNLQFNMESSQEEYKQFSRERQRRR